MDESKTIRIQIAASDDPRDPRAVRAAALVVLRGPDLGRRYVLAHEATLIGRHADADIAINHQSISRRHCEITLCNDQTAAMYVVRELGSTNGTFVNGQKVSESPLADGDKLTLGDVVLKFFLVDTVEEEFHHEVSDMLRTHRQTGLLHIDAFYDELDAALDKSRATQNSLALVMLDIDGLKQINDAHGHLLGSEVIRTVAKSISTACDTVAATPGLYGGDEFIVFLPHGTEETALALSEAVRRDVEHTEYMSNNGDPARVTVSIGLAEFPRDGAAREVLVRRADIALYAAKHSGRNRVVSFRPELEAGASPPDGARGESG